MSLSHSIYAVLLDGQWHEKSEIIQRVKHTLDPMRVVRSYVGGKDRGLLWDRKKREKQGKKEVPKARKTLLKDNVNSVDLNTALVWVIGRSLIGMGRRRRDGNPIIVKEGTKYRLPLEEKSFVKGRSLFCSRIAVELKRNLVLRGELL